MSNDFIRRNFSALSKNNFELHKKLTTSGENPDPLSHILRTDNLEKFQKYLSKIRSNSTQKYPHQYMNQTNLFEIANLLNFALFLDHLIALISF